MLFIDVGNTHSTAFLSHFDATEAQVLVEESERNFGSRNLDKAIVARLAEVFKEQHEITIRSNPKAMTRMQDAASKLRQGLSDQVPNMVM